MESRGWEGCDEDWKMSPRERIRSTYWTTTTPGFLVSGTTSPTPKLGNEEMPELISDPPSVNSKQEHADPDYFKIKPPHRDNFGPPATMTLHQFNNLVKQTDGMIDCLNWASIVRHNARSLKTDQFRVVASWCPPLRKPDACDPKLYRRVRRGFAHGGWGKFCHVKHTGSLEYKKSNRYTAIPQTTDLPLMARPKMVQEDTGEAPEKRKRMVQAYESAGRERRHRTRDRRQMTRERRPNRPNTRERRLRLMSRRRPKIHAS